MIGAAEKGIEAAKLATPPQGVYEGVDLRCLPKYICFRAALLRNQVTYQYLILSLIALFTVHFAASRVELSSLYAKLRAKEYILAPGVQDFTPARAQTVPDSYVKDAVHEYLGELGNVTAANIEEQYALLASSMSPELRVKFLTEADEFKAKVKTQGVSELLSVTSLEIRAREDGYYHAVALVRRDTYINNEYAGHADEAIEMDMELVPPRAGRRWFLQIDSLTRESAEMFSGKQHL